MTTDDEAEPQPQPQDRQSPGPALKKSISLKEIDMPETPEIGIADLNEDDEVEKMEKGPEEELVEDKNEDATPDATCFSENASPQEGDLCDVIVEEEKKSDWKPFDNPELSIEAPLHSPLHHEERRKSVSSLGLGGDGDLTTQLDREFERALQDQQIVLTARYSAINHSASASILFFFFYLVIGTIFYGQYTEWELAESLLFSIYTITTVGYGNHVIPNSTAFHLFTIIYIFVGIAALTVVVAQVYQFFSLLAAKAQFHNDKVELARRGRNLANGSEDAGFRNSTAFEVMMGDEWGNTKTSVDAILDFVVRTGTTVKNFFKNTSLGQHLSVFIPLSGLVVLGALVVGPIEGWTFLESLYWAVVSLTTVGYGDYYPTQSASIWFSIFYLPTSVGFMSVYLSSIARFYIKLSNENAKRIERQLFRKANEQREMENQPHQNNTEMNNVSHLREQEGFQSLPTGDDIRQGNGLFEGQRDTEECAKRREQVYHNSIANNEEHGTTMRDMIQKVKTKMEFLGNKNNSEHDKHRRANSLIFHSQSDQSETSNVPSLSLRVLVQERIAEIIAIDIAGFQSCVEIKENTLMVTIDSLKATANKWMIPRRAQKAFRKVAFESLFFVGDHDLITRGSDALFDLSPVEFHGLFAQFLASMGDRTLMEEWLASTDILAIAEFHKSDGTSLPVNPRNTNASLRLSSTGVSARVLRTSRKAPQQSHDVSDFEPITGKGSLV